MGFTLEFRVCSISFEPFEQFALNFTQMFISVSWCTEPINHPCKLKHNAHFKVTSRSQDFVAGDMAVIQTTVLLL